MSDFTSDRPWRVDPMYVDYARDGGISHEIGERLAGRCVAGASEEAGVRERGLGRHWRCHRCRRRN